MSDTELSFFSFTERRAPPKPRERAQREPTTPAVEDADETRSRALELLRADTPQCEVARLTGLTIGTVRYWAKKHNLKAVPPGTPYTAEEDAEILRRLNAGEHPWQIAKAMASERHSASALNGHVRTLRRRARDAA